MQAMIHVLLARYTQPNSTTAQLDQQLLETHK